MVKSLVISLPGHSNGLSAFHNPTSWLSPPGHYVTHHSIPDTCRDRSWKWCNRGRNKQGFRYVGGSPGHLEQEKGGSYGSDIAETDNLDLNSNIPAIQGNIKSALKRAKMLLTNMLAKCYY